MSLEQLENRKKALETQHANIANQIAQLVGAKRELQEYVQKQMLPGIDHEKVDDRIRQMQQTIVQYQEQLMQIQGGIKETSFWISQTPNGQEPKEAMDQLKHNDADGPITELDLLQSAEDIGANDVPEETQGNNTGNGG